MVRNLAALAWPSLENWEERAVSNLQDPPENGLFVLLYSGIELLPFFRLQDCRGVGQECYVTYTHWHLDATVNP